MARAQYIDVCMHAPGYSSSCTNALHGVDEPTRPRFPPPPCLVSLAAKKTDAFWALVSRFSEGALMCLLQCTTTNKQVLAVSTHLWYEQERLC